MRAILDALKDPQRRVWLFDSFEGLPKPDPESFQQDKDDPHWRYAFCLAVRLEQVKDNFEKYELLDERTQFVKRLVSRHDSPPEVTNILVLRLDGDMYESTWLVLNHLYPKVSPGGFIIVDNYRAIPSCRAAVDNFRAQQSILSPISKVDWTGIFWRK